MVGGVARARGRERRRLWCCGVVLFTMSAQLPRGRSPHRTAPTATRKLQEGVGGMERRGREARNEM